MCNTFPSCERSEIVLQRVALEIGSTADELARLEQSVADLVIAAGAPADFQHLQSLDRLNQQLRTLEAFLHAAGPCSCGRVDIEGALDQVWLEGVRKRLGGGRTPAPAAVEPELW